jgi:hypothetical protein
MRGEDNAVLFHADGIGRGEVGSNPHLVGRCIRLDPLGREREGGIGRLKISICIGHI